MTLLPWIREASRLLWGPGTLLLLTGTGLFLTVRTHFLPWRNLPRALAGVLSREARTARGAGDVSPFSALMTTLAATIGTGNIVGVATALAAGGPGALLWMELSAALGLSSKCAECLLAVKYRQRNSRGEMCGGPMYVMRRAIRPKWLGALLGGIFAISTLLASFGIGDMTQSNSIAAALESAFGLSPLVTGAVVSALALAILSGGIRSIARASSLVVPVMALLYLGAAAAVILGNRSALPGVLEEIVSRAFTSGAAAGGAAGTAAATLADAVRYGVSRGVFSNEAGMGSAAISAASAATDSPVRQGYLNMTGTFFDTMVVCTVTGLAICCSGVLENTAGSGAALTIAAFETVLGPAGGAVVAVCVALFAFSTILGWEYLGEKAFEFLLGTRLVGLYRGLFVLLCLLGAGAELELVFAVSDLFNALMVLPNLICLLACSGTVARELQAYEAARRNRKR